MDSILKYCLHRLDYEVRNKKKEKKEKAAFAAYMKAKEEGRLNIDQICVE